MYVKPIYSARNNENNKLQNLNQSSNYQPLIFLDDVLNIQIMTNALALVDKKNENNLKTNSTKIKILPKFPEIYKNIINI